MMKLQASVFLCVTSLGLLVCGCGNDGGGAPSAPGYERSRATGGVLVAPATIQIPADVKLRVAGDQMTLTITAAQELDLADYGVNVLGEHMIWEEDKPLSPESRKLASGENAEVNFPYDPEMKDGRLMVRPISR